MATHQSTAQQMRASGRARARTHALAAHGEVIAYGVLWAALAAFLWSRIRSVDQFYLDEWIYTHGAEYIWDNLPGSLVGGIPNWDRGPQRLYSMVMAPFWGPLNASTAFTLVHLLNVLLLTSTIVPAALIARRLVDAPVLRVLAVALAVAVPWLAIGAHQMAENLAFPLYVWTLYVIVLAAEQPRLRTQLLALVLIGATTLCRINYAAVFAVLVAAVAAAEIRHRLDHRDIAWGPWARAMLKRRWPVGAPTAGARVGARFFVTGGSAARGR
jgi:hypothetical protein